MCSCIQSGTPKHLQMKLTRQKLEELCKTLIDRTLPPCTNALRDANIQKKQVDEVILVGGMTRMPKVRISHLHCIPAKVENRFSVITLIIII